ncbi:hypothetical protein ACFL0V_01020 [Nanoarchaeota archaeon]
MVRRLCTLVTAFFLAASAATFGAPRKNSQTSYPPPAGRSAQPSEKFLHCYDFGPTMMVETRSKTRSGHPILMIDYVNPTTLNQQQCRYGFEVPTPFHTFLYAPNAPFYNRKP